jgi:hypothetical protein
VGKYKLSCEGLVNGYDVKYQFIYINGSSATEIATCSQSKPTAEFEVTDEMLAYKMGIRLITMPSTTVDNCTIYPQLQYATNDRHYIATNKELTNKVTTLEKSYVDKEIWKVQGELGAKNLIPYPYLMTTKTNNGVTITDNGDGTLTVNGTAQTAVYFNLCNIDFGNVHIGSANSEYIMSDGVDHSLGIEVGYIQVIKSHL